MIDLGNEPPLSVDGDGGLIDRRRLSVQWFSGTILTGLCGAALMGGAVFASLDGETNFASAPERVESALRGAITSIGDRLSGLRKTDRLPALSEPSVARQVLRIPYSTHAHDRELVRVRPYVRVSGNLSLTVTDLSANLPAFNSQKLLVRFRYRRRPNAGGGAGRRSFLRHLRSRRANAAPQGGARGLRHQFAVVAGEAVDAVAAR